MHIKLFHTIMIDQQGILHIKWLDRDLKHVSCSPFTLGEGVNNDHYVKNTRDCESLFPISAFSSHGFVLNETGGRLLQLIVMLCLCKTVRISRADLGELVTRGIIIKF